MLADRRLQLGDKFNLREFHDYVWSNGNVPLSLQRWELLGLDDDVKKLDAGAKVKHFRSGVYRCSVIPRPNTKMKTSDTAAAAMSHA